MPRLGAAATVLAVCVVFGVRRKLAEQAAKLPQLQPDAGPDADAAPLATPVPITSARTAAAS
jgi:hypothetical protein